VVVADLAVAVGGEDDDERSFALKPIHDIMKTNQTP
jgi:hypothetical protein